VDHETGGVLANFDVTQFHDIAMATDCVSPDRRPAKPMISVFEL
jgi:hypothetical protein